MDLKTTISQPTRWGKKLVVNINHDSEKPPIPSEAFHFCRCVALPKEIVASSVTYNSDSLFVIAWPFDGYTKMFLAHLQYEIEDRKNEAIKNFIAMVIAPLNDECIENCFEEEGEAYVLDAITEGKISNPKVLIDILNRLKKIIDHEVEYHVIKSVLPTHGLSQNDLFIDRLQNFKQIVSPELKEQTLGPAFTMYVLAYYLFHPYPHLWQEFWSLDVVGRWDLVTKVFAGVYEKVPDQIKKPKSQPAEKQSSPPPSDSEKKATQEPSDMLEKIQNLKISTESKHKLLYELKKLESAQSQDKNNITDWLTQVVDFPWGKTTAKPIDFSTLRAEMDVTHYGLPEVKDSLLEHLVIEAITKSQKGGIICFAGPPGTGKTSIAKTLAKVSGRKYVSMPLGGVSDENEIRGHRRTYVSAKAGRIVTLLQQVNCIDPVIVFDEIDKTPVKGMYSPISSALLEILDPEQNTNFCDRYLELPVDLSKILFICTANDVDSIPPALKDRMEIIMFREYSLEERRTILLEYMIGSAKKDFSLEDYSIVFEKSAIEYLIQEVQLRQIDLQLRRLLRKAATKIFLNQVESVVFTKELILEYLSLKNVVAKRATVGFRM